MMKCKTTLCVLIMVLLSGGLVFAFGKKIMSVQIKEAHVRSAPSFLSEIVGRFSYGDRVWVSDERGSWRKVGPAEGVVKGWMHASALTKKKIVLEPGDADVEEAATTDELALAGRGFNRQVEEHFSSNNPDVDYTWINRMEQIVVSNDQMRSFLEAGGLSPKGGSR